ncbi:hypothetical protein BGX23_000422, partial [Mortierella sp. AD031]
MRHFNQSKNSGQRWDKNPGMGLPHKVRLKPIRNELSGGRSGTVPTRSPISATIWACLSTLAHWCRLPSSEIVMKPGNMTKKTNTADTNRVRQVIDHSYAELVNLMEKQDDEVIDLTEE